MLKTLQKITLNVDKLHVNQMKIKTSLQARFLLVVHGWNYAQIFEFICNIFRGGMGEIR